MDRLKRRDIVVVAVPGDYGKPRHETIGRLDDDLTVQVNRSLALWLGITAWSHDAVTGSCGTPLTIPYSSGSRLNARGDSGGTRRRPAVHLLERLP
jgi:hypothetical protein